MIDCTAVIFSHPSRGELRAKTRQLLVERTDQPDVPTPLIWTGDGEACDDDRCCIPIAGRERQRDVHDFRQLLLSPLLERGPLLFLEDDVEPCFNALPYMLRWGAQYLTSFYNPYRRVGLNRGFIFSQAWWAPAELVARMRSEPFPPPDPKLQRDGIDVIVHRYLTRWNLPFFQHRSLVQHVGEVSTWSPTATLKQNGRRSIDWPGPTIDAFKLKP